MHELSSLLHQNMPAEPPEIRLIKDFVRENFQADCTVTMSPVQIIVGVRSAALAGALRARLHELGDQGIKQRLLIRISS